MPDYVFVLMERDTLYGTSLRGIFTSRYEAEEAMEQLKSERNDSDIYSFWVDRVNINQIIR